MEEHIRNVTQFHETLKRFTDWLNSAEIMMRSFKHPSKLVDTVTKQIDEHNVSHCGRIMIINPMRLHYCFYFRGGERSLCLPDFWSYFINDKVM